MTNMMTVEDDDSLTADLWSLIDALKAKGLQLIDRAPCTFSSDAFNALSPHDKTFVLQRLRGSRLDASWRIFWDAQERVFTVGTRPPLAEPSPDDTSEETIPRIHAYVRDQIQSGSFAYGGVIPLQEFLGTNESHAARIGTQLDGARRPVAADSRVMFTLKWHPQSGQLEVRVPDYPIT